MKRLMVIGGGLIGARHVAAVKAHPGAELLALVDPDPDLLCDAPRLSAMSEAKIAPDGVIIATPTHLHAEHGIEAARNGWDILIEKPVAGTLEEAQGLAEVLHQTGRKSLVGHHRRYHAPVQQLKSLIADGAIGTVVTATLIWAMRKPDAYFQGNWRTAGGSPVMINLVHDIDILRFCIGEIAETVALPGRRLRATDRIESGAVALAFENGATGTISFADTAPSPWGFEAGTAENPNIGATRQDMMWITGTKGAVSFPSMTLWRGDDWSKPATNAPVEVAHNAGTPLDMQLQHFLDVMDGAAPLIDVADATRTLATAIDIEQQLLPRSTPRRAQV